MANNNAITPQSDGGGGGNTEGAATMWGGIGDAISQGVRQHRTDVQAKQDRQYLLAQRDKLQKQQDMDLAGARIKMIVPQLLAHPELANHPEYKAILNQSYDTMGLPKPLNPDGTYNLDSFKQPVPDDTLSKVLALPIGSARDAQLNHLKNQYTGITPDMYTADVAVTPTQAAAISKAVAYSNHEKTADEIHADHERNWELLNGAKVGEVTQETKNLLVKNAEIQQETLRLAAQTADIPQRTAIMQQNANNAITRVEHMISSRSITHSSWSAAQTQMKQIASEYNRDVDLVQKLKAQEAALYAGGHGPGDPQYDTVDAQVDTATKAVTAFQPTMDRVTGYLKANVDDIITSAHLSNVTGKPASILDSSGNPKNKPIGDAPPGTPDGTTGTMPNGKAAIARGGKLYYL